MSEDLSALAERVRGEAQSAADLRALDAVRVAALGKSGALTALLKGLGAVAPEERRARGAALNEAKGAIEALLDERRASLEESALEARLAAERLDVTLPARPAAPSSAGSIHPISRTVEELTAIFGAMGFRVAEGPDIESDWHNFGALNIPEHHPARQDHDTFYLPAAAGGYLPAAGGGYLPAAGGRHVPAAGESGTHGDAARRVLRTHTSPVQARTMLSQPPPIRVIIPGRTWRADHDATHSPMFHQVEGLVIEEGITLGHLKGCLTDFLRAFFETPELPVRFRSSYFPFTEPSMEVDIAWNRRTGELGAGTDWLEILGSGMVHPRVLANCGLDPSVHQGFAFGMGIERITMLKHSIPDLRPFYEADTRWLAHHGTSPLQPASLHEGV